MIKLSLTFTNFIANVLMAGLPWPRKESSRSVIFQSISAAFDCRNSFCTISRQKHFHSKADEHLLKRALYVSAPGNYNVARYTHRFGDCIGHDIKSMVNVQKEACAAQCNSLPKCKTFFWEDRGRSSRCWIKNYACPSLTSSNVKTYHFYNKVQPVKGKRWFCF